MVVVVVVLVMVVVMVVVMVLVMVLVMVVVLVACFTSQQHASVSQGPICSDLGRSVPEIH